MTIDDLKLDELEHFAKSTFREIDMQFMKSLPSNDDKLAYINGMLNTSIAQGALLSFRWQKLTQAVADAFKPIVEAVSNVFKGISDTLKRLMP